MCLETTNTYKIYKHTKKEHHVKRVQNEFRIRIPGQTAPLSWNVCSVFMSFAIFTILQASGVVARKLNNWCTGAFVQGRNSAWVSMNQYVSKKCQHKNHQKPRMCRMCHNFEGQAVMVHTACAHLCARCDMYATCEGFGTKRWTTDDPESGAEGFTKEANASDSSTNHEISQISSRKKGEKQLIKNHKIWNAETRNRMESILLKFWAFSWSRFCKAPNITKHHLSLDVWHSFPARVATVSVAVRAKRKHGIDSEVKKCVARLSTNWQTRWGYAISIGEGQNSERRRKQTELVRVMRCNARPRHASFNETSEPDSLTTVRSSSH